MLLAAIDRWRAPAPPASRVAWLGQHDYAHRGLHGPGVPENSLRACADAIARGFGIECDVQRSADGQPVVFHDWDLDRLTDAEGPVRTRSLVDLAQLDLMESGERIPSLRDFLGMVRDRVPVLIEIKSRRDHRVGGLCLAVRRVLEGYRGLHAVMSFDPRVSRWFAAHSPHTLRGLVLSEENGRSFPGRLRRHLALWHARPDFLAYDVRDLPSSFAASQRGRGMPVLTWTVRSAGAWVSSSAGHTVPARWSAGRISNMRRSSLTWLRRSPGSRRLPIATG